MTGVKRLRGSQGIGLLPIAGLAILLYTAFQLYPLVRSFIESFTNSSPLYPTSDWIGLANYVELLADPRFLASLRFTFILAIFVTVASNVIGLLLAVLLNRTGRNFRVMKTLIFIPQVISGVVVGFIWRSILTQNGLLNTSLLNAGAIDAPISWLGTTEFATLSICIVFSWVMIAFATVVYTASLQGVPAELYEAARMDGASALSRFRNVTLPMIAPGVTITVTLCLIGAFKAFDIIAVMTGGGPLRRRSRRPSTSSPWRSATTASATHPRSRWCCSWSPPSSRTAPRTCFAAGRSTCEHHDSPDRRIAARAGGSAQSPRTEDSRTASAVGEAARPLAHGVLDRRRLVRHLRVRVPDRHRPVERVQDPGADP